MPNHKAFWTAAKHIRNNPELHDQTLWLERKSCGTTGCLAGHLAVQGGAEILWDEPESTLDIVFWCITPDGKKMEIAEFAGQILDVDVDIQDELFDPTRTIDEIESIWREFAE